MVESGLEHVIRKQRETREGDKQGRGEQDGDFIEEPWKPAVAQLQG